MINKKFKYYFQQGNEIIAKVYTLEDIENGKLTQNINFPKVISRVQNVESYQKDIDLFEEDIVYWEDVEGYGWEAIKCSGIAIVKYNIDSFRTMFFDPFSEEWFELDDFDFKYIKGNTIQNPDLLPNYEIHIKGN